MRNLATLPKPVLLLEALGVLAVIGALLLVNDWLAAPAFMAKNRWQRCCFSSALR